jgi:hypothetical protein
MSMSYALRPLAIFSILKGSMHCKSLELYHQIHGFIDQKGFQIKISLRLSNQNKAFLLLFNTTIVVDWIFDAACRASIQG